MKNEILLCELQIFGLSGAKFVTIHSTLTLLLHFFPPNMYHFAWLLLTHTIFPYYLTQMSWIYVESWKFQLFHDSIPQEVSILANLGNILDHFSQPSIQSTHIKVFPSLEAYVLDLWKSFRYMRTMIWKLQIFGHKWHNVNLVTKPFFQWKL